MRLIHTSDWHLGHALHDAPREYEHARFIAWLIDTVHAEAADALVITGDVFDSANPPATAQQRWYDFLAETRRRCPDLDIVVIGGNHDSAARLDAPERLLRAMRIHVVGGLPHEDLERLVVPLHDATGNVAAWVAAVPFLRPADLRRDVEGPTGDPLVEGVRAVYAEALAAARARRQPGQALIATGHCFMVSTKVSQLSERRILGGNQHALPANVFDDDVDYVALGHLHKPQKVGPTDRIRYAGAPIALAMNERGYKHQVRVVDFQDGALVGTRAVEVPRVVDIVRVPARGSLPVDEVLAALLALDVEVPGEPHDQRPLLEVCAALPKPEPRLRHRVEAALDGRRPRLVRLEVEYTGTGLSLGENLPGVELRTLDPEDVFVRRYQRDHQGDPSPEMLTAFRELLDEARAGESA